MSKNIPFHHTRIINSYPPELHTLTFLQLPEIRQLSQILIRINLEVGSASLINTWLCDTYASARTTPILLVLEQEDEDGNSLVEKQPPVHVEIVDDH
jgi:hypothetical protein